MGWSQELYLLVLLHGGVQLLGQVIGHTGHTGFLLVGAADAAFILVCFFVVLLLGILAVTLTALQHKLSCHNRLPIVSRGSWQTPHAQALNIQLPRKETWRRKGQGQKQNLTTTAGGHTTSPGKTDPDTSLETQGLTAK